FNKPIRGATPSMMRTLVPLMALSCLSLPSPSSHSDDAWQKIAPFFTPPDEFKHDFGPYRSVLKFKGGRVVQTPYDWKRRRAEILRDWTEMLGPWPPAIDRPSVKFLSQEHVENFTRRKVEIEIA